MNVADHELIRVLDAGRDLGFLGPGSVEPHVLHAASFVPLLSRASRVLDLGSGGGLPGLVIARAQPGLELVLLDANARRTDFLRHAVDLLELAGRVQVRTGRAEVLAREPELRHSFDAVVSRSFAPPAVTAECGVGFLTGDGSFLLVSEPPAAAGDGRWPADGLAELSLRPGERIVDAHATIQVLESTGRCGERFPRPTGRPAKRPLF